MDPNAVNANVTVDDFDSVILYADQSVWSTPDPSSSTFTAEGSPWLMGTYHLTDTVDATLAFNFTGPALYIYGHHGPAYGSFSVDIDSSSSTFSAYAATNGSTPQLLYGTSALSYSSHSLVLRNLGAKATGEGDGLLFDFIRTTVQLAPAGATVSNTTIEESDPALTYSGTWNTNKSPNFSGGGSSYTQEDGASVSLSFHGSAVYVLGDKKNDHGLYTAVLDDGPPQTFNGISGCGGAFGMTCEQMKPTLAFFASNLDEKPHTLKITNVAGVNQSFFDLDSIILSVPSKYAPRDLSQTTGSSSTSATISGSTPSTTASQSSAAHSLVYSNSLLLFLVLGITLLFRPRSRL
ncbi:hypothetical protein C8J56DRAFT_1121302 [Mycena floridula]|nr:hypothetical protein C8J56DRAFT_1121302 [Mycena floridula]